MGDAPNGDKHDEKNACGKNDVPKPELEALQEPSVPQNMKQPDDATHMPKEIPKMSCEEKPNTVAESHEAVADAEGQQDMKSDEETEKLRASKGTFKEGLGELTSSLSDMVYLFFAQPVCPLRLCICVV